MTFFETCADGLRCPGEMNALTPLLTIASILALASTAQAAEPPFADEVPIFAEDISSANAAHFADLDRDGDLDIVLAGGTSVYWFENSDGLAAPMIERNVDPGLLTSEEAFVTDVDSDGDLDIINSGEGLRWYENIEDASGFQRHDIVLEDDNVTGKIGFGDVDGDGERDIVLANTETETLSYFASGGDSTFDDPVEIPLELSSVDYVAVADFIAGGAAEIAVAGSYGNELLLLERSGGTWTSYALDAGTGVEELRVADVSGDGAVDLLVGGDEHAAALINLGGGVFGSEPVATSDASDVGYQLVAADIDGDGDKDLVSSRWSVEDALAWHDNNDGSFGSAQPIIDRIDGFAALDVGDADCDGDDDLIALAPVDNLLAIYVLENTTLQPSGEPSDACIGAGDDGAVAGGGGDDGDDDDDDDGNADDTGGDDGPDDGSGGSDDAGDDDGDDAGTGGRPDDVAHNDDSGGLCSVHPQRTVPAAAFALFGLLLWTRRR